MGAVPVVTPNYFLHYKFYLSRHAGRRIEGYFHLVRNFYQTLSFLGEHITLKRSYLTAIMLYELIECKKFICYAGRQVLSSVFQISLLMHANHNC
jgi:hypothetical protein